MTKSYDGFIGGADTPYVMSVFPPGFTSGVDTAETHYCYTPEDVLNAVKAEAGTEPSAEEIVKLLMCWNGEGVTINGFEFSIEREW